MKAWGLALIAGSAVSFTSLSPLPRFVRSLQSLDRKVGLLGSDGRGILRSSARQGFASMRFHGEGDYSSRGMPPLSGAWSLRTCVDGSCAPETIVTLGPKGIFSTPQGALHSIEGKWSVTERELTIAIYGIAKTVRTWYVGTIADDSKTVAGHIADGAIDPEWVGNFTLNQLLPELGADLNRPKVDERPIYRHQQFYGSWRVETYRQGPQTLAQSTMPQSKRDQRKSLQQESRKRKGPLPVKLDKTPSTGFSTGSVFDITLYSNSTWETTGGLGSGRLAGRWNVFDDEIELGTGIKGTGRSIWLQARRFKVGGGIESTGVSMSSDLLYIGRISVTLENLDAPESAEDKESVAASEASADVKALSELASADEVVQDAEVVEEKNEGELDKAAVDKDDGRGAMRLAMRVSGHIAYGYQGEPAFIGRFNMTRPVNVQTE